MFSNEADPPSMAAVVVKALGSHKKTLSHGRHINIEAGKLGIKVRALEDEPELQNAVLSVHHCYTVTLQMTATAAIIENHLGMRYVNEQTNPDSGTLAPRQDSARGPILKCI